MASRYTRWLSRLVLVAALAQGAFLPGLAGFAAAAQTSPLCIPPCHMAPFQ